MSLLLNTLNIMKVMAKFFLRSGYACLALLCSFTFLAAAAADGRIHIIPQPVSVTEKPGTLSSGPVQRSW
jgi:hypothetical protein